MSSRAKTPPNWLQTNERGFILRLHIQPKASKSEVKGLHGDRLKIRVAAPPVDGEANEELLRFLKRTISVSGLSLTLLRGQTSREKDVLVEGADIGVVLAALRPT